MTPSGHAALVTGGASGLGLATARALIDAGAKVTLLDVDAARLAEAGQALGALALVCDVTRAEDAEAAVAQAAAAHGTARILINCAGIGPAARVVSRSGPMALDAFRRVIEINLIGSFNLLRLFAAGAQTLEPLEGGERGIAINTASVAAYDGQIGQAAYSASKGGVVAMTLPIARELASTGIRVCTIAPGLFETPMLMGMPQGVRDSLGASVPFPPRLGRGEEYAHLALHIIANIMLNGETIRLDGALRMAPK